MAARRSAVSVFPHRPRTFERDCRKTADQLIQLAIDDSGQIAPHRRKSYYLDAFNTTDRTVPTLPIGRLVACNTVMAVDRKVGYGMAMADTRASANSRVVDMMIHLHQHCRRVGRQS